MTQNAPQEFESGNRLSAEKTDLVVALDYSKADAALALVDRLKDLPQSDRILYKVGLELFMAGGAELVRELTHHKLRVFLDLKFHDIPNTVARAARQAAVMHVEMFTLHLAGGSQMVRAVAEELAGIPSLKPKILGVSVLTSFDDVRWAEVTRALTTHAVSVEDSVEGLIEHATAWGVDGVVCSAHELARIRHHYPKTYTVVPGIRPAGFASGDQARVMTPAQAALAGAHAIVVGRPITEAAEPVSVVQSIFQELATAAFSSPNSHLVHPMVHPKVPS